MIGRFLLNFLLTCVYYLFAWNHYIALICTWESSLKESMEAPEITCDARTLKQIYY
jgi:hypothetical protein